MSPVCAPAAPKAKKPRKRHVRAADYPLPFKDLPKRVKALAIEKWQEREDSGEWESVKECLVNDLADYYGLHDCELCADLSYCQGSGVAFWGTPDLDVWAKHAAKMNEKDRDTTLQDALTLLHAYAGIMGADDLRISVEINHSGNYYHECSMTVSVECDWCWNSDFRVDSKLVDETLNPMVDAIEKHCQEAVKAISRALEHDGYENLEYYRSEEYITEYLSGCDHYEFNQEGELD